jgi:hypothetical protein
MLVWPPLWSSGHWLQIQRSGFDSWRYQIFWKVVGLERGPLSLVSTIEEILVWEPSMGTSHRLPRPVSKQQLDKQNYRGNQQS